MEKKVAIQETHMGLESPLVVSKIFDNCIYSGFYGRLDSERIKIITESILDAIEIHDSDYMIIDLSNIDLIDSAVAAHLFKISKSLRISGIEVIICGIRATVAQTMSIIGVDLASFNIVRDLKKALEVVYKKSGYKLVKIED